MDKITEEDFPPWRSDAYSLLEEMLKSRGSFNVRAEVTRQYQPKPMACARIVAQPFFGYKAGMKTIASHAGVFYG